jgi:predicted Zn finger-like uncharacterized protein
LEYIECTHCGKRYAASEKIHASEGKFVRCKNCLEKFMIVVHDSEKRGLASDDDNFDATGGWDPTLTAPPHDAVNLDAEQNQSDTDSIASDHDTSSTDEDDSVIEWDPSLTMPTADAEQDEEEAQLSDEEIQAKAEAALADAKKEKQKKIILFVVLGVVLMLLALTLYMALSGDEEQNIAPQHALAPKPLSLEELDKNSPKCRAAAARQWLLDYKAMHDDYDANTFIHMLEQSQYRADDVKKACKSPTLLKKILDAATAGNKPEWISKEIATYTRK